MSQYRSGIYARGVRAPGSGGLHLSPPLPGFDDALDSECARIYRAVGADLARPPSADALADAILGRGSVNDAADDAGPHGCDAEIEPDLGGELRVRLRADLKPSRRAYGLFYLLASREVRRDSLADCDFELACDKLARALWMPAPAIEAARAVGWTLAELARSRSATELDVVLRCADADPEGYSLVVIDDREVRVRGALALFSPRASDMRRLARGPLTRLHRFFLPLERAFVVSDRPNCHVL